MNRDEPRTRRMRRAAGALGLGLAVSLAAACGKDDASDTSSQLSTTAHDDADVAFATAMIPHHAQALAMADMTAGRKLDRQVRTLVDSIRESQTPEIETMADWLTEWGEDVPSTMRDHLHAGHDMGDTGGMEDMPGMMSSEDMAGLQKASDAEFQDMWLQMMIEHHEGAVEMARTEQEEGRFEPAVDLADQIIASQSTEIDAMQDLLGP